MAEVEIEVTKEYFSDIDATGLKIDQVFTGEQGEHLRVFGAHSPVSLDKNEGYRVTGRTRTDDLDYTPCVCRIQEAGQEESESDVVWLGASGTTEWQYFDVFIHNSVSFMLGAVLTADPTRS